MEVRRARAGDATALLELWFELSADGRRADDRYEIAGDAAETICAVVGGWCAGEQPAWVAEIDDGIVGFIVARWAPAHPVLRHPATLVITDAYVVERHRRRAVGHRLVEEVRTFAAARQCGRLEVGTLARDHRAVGFWRSFGLTTGASRSRGSSNTERSLPSTLVVR